MESIHPDALRRKGRGQGMDPFLHFLSRLVREGEGKDLTGSCPPGTDQIGDPVGEGHGLSGPGTGHDQEMFMLLKDGFFLIVIERVKDRVLWFFFLDRNLILFFFLFENLFRGWGLFAF
jgi:hypothetical protein